MSPTEDLQDVQYHRKVQVGTHCDVSSSRGSVTRSKHDRFFCGKHDPPPGWLYHRVAVDLDGRYAAWHKPPGHAGNLLDHLCEPVDRPRLEENVTAAEHPLAWGEASLRAVAQRAP